MYSTRNIGQVAIELLVLGIASIVINFLIYSAFTRTFEWPNFKKKGTIEMYLGGIILVAILHAGFEYSGINEKWCRAMYK